MGEIMIYPNPKRSKSRQTLALLRERPIVTANGRPPENVLSIL